MKTKAAVLWGLHQKWEVEELDLDGPKEREVLVKLTASGLCHSDDHLVTGDMPMNLPVVGGHEGAGVVVDVGPGVTDVAPGDHVVLSFIPACGRCRACARGMSNLCDYGAAIMAGPQLDGTFRFHGRGEDRHARVLLDLEDAYAGAMRQITLEVPEVDERGRGHGEGRRPALLGQQVDRQRGVAGAGQPAGHAADPVAQPLVLVDHQHTAARIGGGRPGALQFTGRAGPGDRCGGYGVFHAGRGCRRFRRRAASGRGAVVLRAGGHQCCCGSGRYTQQGQSAQRFAAGQQPVGVIGGDLLGDIAL